MSDATPDQLLSLFYRSRSRRGHGSKHAVNRARYADRLRVRIAELEQRLQRIEGGRNG